MIGEAHPTTHLYNHTCSQFSPAVVAGPSAAVVAGHSATAARSQSVPLSTVMEGTPYNFTCGIIVVGLSTHHSHDLSL